MKLIKFTRADNGPTFINSENLQDIQESADQPTLTRLSYGADFKFSVTESPRDVVSAIEDSGIKLISLTRPDGKPRWVNPNLIAAVSPTVVNRNGFKADIVFGSGASIHVSESPQTVVNLAEQASQRATSGLPLTFSNTTTAASLTHADNSPISTSHRQLAQKKRRRKRARV